MKEALILQHVSIGDIVTYRDKGDNEATGRCVGFSTFHNGIIHLIIGAEKYVPLYCVLSRQRGQEIVHFRNQPAMV